MTNQDPKEKFLEALAKKQNKNSPTPSVKRSGTKSPTNAQTERTKNQIFRRKSGSA